MTETLPDRVLEMADEIEFIDLSPAELRDRLKDGLIYRPDVAARALESFFREGNLAALREIGLRRAAQRVGSGCARLHVVPTLWPAHGPLVTACSHWCGADGGADTVVRAAKRLADALRSPLDRAASGGERRG